MNFDTHELKAGKKWLEEAAERAEGLHERGEPMGLPPASSLSIPISSKLIDLPRSILNYRLSAVNVPIWDPYNHISNNTVNQTLSRAHRQLQMLCSHCLQHHMRVTGSCFLTSMTLWMRNEDEEAADMDYSSNNASKGCDKIKVLEAERSRMVLKVVISST